MDKIRLLLASANYETNVSLRALLEPFHEYKIIGDADNGQKAIEMALHYLPDIVVLSTHLPGIDGLEATQQIVGQAPYIGVILFGAGDPVELMRRSMQAGAGDFLEFPVTGARLRKSITSLFEVKKRQRAHLSENPLVVPRRQPRVISVFSSKGGVGKTLVAVNLAVCLRELTRGDLLLLDLDLQFGNVADMLGLEAKTNIINLLADRGQIEHTELDRYLVAHESGVRVLPAPPEPDQADLVGEEDVRDLLSLFTKTFDYIVIDLPPLFNDVVLTSLERADHLLLITTLEIPTVKNVKGGIDILKRLDFPPEKLHLVINRHNPNRELGVDDVRRYLGVRNLFLIDDNPERVIQSINTGEPLVLQSREAPAARQIAKLADHLIRYDRPGELDRRASGDGKPSFLSRLFGKGAPQDG
ncbi:AAA family ATPase [Heliobacterium gestii]|uniref:Stage 0 sporulation protein A homolog n=1 Tax=Heliomicrobium gestii TaxID=2699 RepID=A0A845LDC9_HELGE|nr:AAA family ATPase [Heliomicrobium gestii]MBM7866199.1 pilus assembly protein CpaE [Heliomicrobium gestii]MZP42475.1 AAA family ATPase [Heliomicrobium gestii]